MKEINLTYIDCCRIKDMAIKEYINSPTKHDAANIESIVKAFLIFSKANNIEVNDGKLYKNEKR